MSATWTLPAWSVRREGRESRLGEETGSGEVIETIGQSSVAPGWLAIGPVVSLDLGAVFRTKRLGNDDLIDARLYDLKGAYGSSILAGLSIGI